MLRIIGTIFTGLHDFGRSFWRRLRLQGPLATLQWLRTVGLAWLTGRLSLRYSRVTPNILLGPQFGQYGKRSLEKAGVTASMSLRAEFNDADNDLALTDYSYLPTLDNTPPTLEQLEEGVAFIRGVVESDGIIYVHCGSGVGRAPTMVAAYLVAEGASVDNAIARITEVRPFIRVLPDQVARLKEYEAHLQSL